jgi:hypothetical protein
MCRSEDSICCKANPCGRHSRVRLLPWRTAQQGSPATVAAAQGGRHIPCAVPKIQSVAKRTLADGTAECACYRGERHSRVRLLPWRLPKVVGTFHVPFRRFNLLQSEPLRTAQQSVPATVANGTAGFACYRSESRRKITSLGFYSRPRTPR